MASAPGGRARVGALLALMMALVPGCTSGGWGDGRAATVRLDQRGGDAFAWSERVSGSAVCAEVTLLVNGRPLPGGANVPVKDGRFSAVVPLGKGRNRIVARCAQGGGGAGESAPLEFTGRLKARPTAWIRVSVDGDTVTLDGGHSQPAEPDRARVVRYAWSPDPRHPASLTTPAGRRFGGEVDGPRLRLRAPDQDGEYHVRLTVTDAKGRADTSTAYFAVEGDKARAVDMAREHPRWIDSAVIYAPVPALWGDDGPAAVERHLELVSSTPDSSFAYLRPAPPGGEPVLVVLNFGGRAAVELRRTPRLDAALRGQGAMRDLLSDRPVRVEAGPKTVTVPMAAESAHVLTRGAG